MVATRVPAGAALGAVAGVVVLFEVERFHRLAGWRAERTA